MRWQAWPALLATLVWGLFLWALVVGYTRGGRFDVVAPLILGGGPLLVSLIALVGQWRAAQWDGAVPRRPASLSRAWLIRLVAALAATLILLGFTLALMSAQAFSFDFGWDSGPVAPARLLPGGSEVWAYLAALALTAAVAGRSWRAGIVALTALGLSGIAGGAALSAFASGVVATGPYPAGGCAEHVRVVVHVPNVAPVFTWPYFSTGTGELDGASVGFASVTHYPGTSAYVRYDTRWGSGSHDLKGEEGAPSLRCARP